MGRSRAKPAVQQGDGVVLYAELNAAHLVERGLALARELLARGPVTSHEAVEISESGGGRIRVLLVPEGGQAIVLVEGDVGSSLPMPDGLTPRQAQVLRLAAQQKGNDEICQELGLKRATVRSHLQDAYRKARAEAESLPSRGGRSRRERSFDQALRRLGLTERQASVARLAAAGLTNDQIGAELGLSGKTVGPILTKVYRLLGVSRRAELAARLLRRP